MSFINRFDWALSVPEADLDVLIAGYSPIPWIDFVLNPRRLRGSDFLMRWSQGRWSEHRIKEAVNNTGRFFAVSYGPSSVAPEDPREMELYFEKLDAAGIGSIKRPDLLIFDADKKQQVNEFLRKLGGESKLPFTPEDNLNPLLKTALLAVECENSLWIAAKMPHYTRELTPQKRLGGKKGLPKSAVVPTIILKEEDRNPLKSWRNQHGVAIHVWHVFYDAAFGISLDDAERLIESGQIEGNEQIFQAPSGATTRKVIYKIIYHFAYCVGKSLEDPALIADKIVDKNGHILPYVRFDGGRMLLDEEAIGVIDHLS